MDVSGARALFPALEQVTYLNTAAVNVGCTPAVHAYERAVRQWRDGGFSYVEAERAGEDARRLFAPLIRADVPEIALVPAVSASAGIVAAQLGPAKPGENVLVADLEFSSNFFPWVLLRDRGYDIRVIRSSDGAVPPDAYAAEADDNTRLIAVSAVQSASGYRADLRTLSDLAHASGGWLFVDACQAAGAIPIDVRRDGIDFLAAASHKFLLGSRGMGYLYVRRELLPEIRPVGPGWKAGREPFESFYGPAMELSETASKLDQSLAWFPALAERESLGVFQKVGVEKVLRRNLALSRYLHSRLEERGIRSAFPEEGRSTIVSAPVGDPEATLARFKKEKVIVALRGGRVRISVHFYNTESEIGRVAEMLSGR